MYAMVLFAHSWMRWLVLTLTVLALWRGASGLVTRRPWTSADGALRVAFVAAIDTQALLGLSLYFVLSPIVPKTLADLQAAMPLGALRFFAVEHITMMLFALIAAHVTSVLCKRAKEVRARQKRLTWGVGVTFALLMAAIPWPWMSAARPLMRGF
jgi:hypothetical protein